MKDTTQHTDNSIATGQTVDPDEVAFFAKIADTWWDPKGPFKPLHQLNPTRLTYIRQQCEAHFSLDPQGLQPLKGLTVLDIGCGGGLISEPMCRLGATVTGVDASEKNVKTALAHAHQTDLDITYVNTTSEALAEAGEKFDIIINMEVIEHVADVQAYLTSCKKLLKPEGIMLVSTISRTAKSMLFAKIGAEYIMRWLPVGAHDWNKFITPDELQHYLSDAGFLSSRATGFCYNMLKGKWRLDETDTAVNYAVSVTIP
ncbi:bifunctional 2-polyprenyl-6-hydroxyphenol methylase/3-demethylubiquinol 3-O-methyltransferase UbiG [Temperatibacter marinus]|uniref:Ubiquinone biosynthesis O-methyltransferase n=1 Tax=Temperatibacter marinus TaxID=1456591 RepID=A0AA52H982_9PROT|nr:bifunctional 2-polyprenyl-6-hydroxyphenol methylase/3-demethylubiquinol 3-O-methyltransferase UbiG [Temperatibacter marinus]WND01373.1 bifunctional 2-polyprenyl-6-hydroxyphenol methylase/3-demethylubiquinol 3-O-methyltransferase UbiG [Temperatibacter marinus]